MYNITSHHVTLSVSIISNVVYLIVMYSGPVLLIECGSLWLWDRLCLGLGVTICTIYSTGSFSVDKCVVMLLLISCYYYYYYYHFFHLFYYFRSN